MFAKRLYDSAKLAFRSKNENNIRNTIISPSFLYIRRYFAYLAGNSRKFAEIMVFFMICYVCWETDSIIQQYSDLLRPYETVALFIAGRLYNAAIF